LNSENKSGDRLFFVSESEKLMKMVEAAFPSDVIEGTVRYLSALRNSWFSFERVGLRPDCKAEILLDVGQADWDPAFAEKLDGFIAKLTSQSAKPFPEFVQFHPRGHIAYLSQFLERKRALSLPDAEWNRLFHEEGGTYLLVSSMEPGEVTSLLDTLNIPSNKFTFFQSIRGLSKRERSVQLKRYWEAFVESEQQFCGALFCDEEASKYLGRRTDDRFGHDVVVEKGVPRTLQKLVAKVRRSLLPAVPNQNQE
jgi:hypothetical protein